MASTISLHNLSLQILSVIFHGEEVLNFFGFLCVFIFVALAALSYWLIKRDE